MIRRSTWFVVVVFLVLVASVLYWNNREVPPGEAGETPQSSLGVETALVFDIPEGVYVAGLRVEDAEGNLVEMQRKDEESPWAIIEPPRDDADSDRIQGVVDQLTFMSVDTALVTAPELDVVGLEAPQYSILLTFSDGQQHSLYIGDETITTTSYYARLDDGLPFVVGMYDVESAVGILENLPVLPTPTSESEPVLTEEP
ncbi:MAG: DUF4340 domain-containing protein [Chloroflexi bacterium]|nr:DUF4340 domain-containing protein [Chloroflexota bacterium]